LVVYITTDREPSEVKLPHCPVPSPRRSLIKAPAQVKETVRETHPPNDPVEPLG